MTQHIKLGGRLFKPCTCSTIEHDYTTMDLVRVMGLDTLEMPEGADPHGFVIELLGRITRSGHLFELLGCMLIPAEATGADWTPDVAADTARFIKRLSSEEDKRVVHEQVVALLLSFFQAGLTTLTTTPSFSAAAESAVGPGAAIAA